MNPDPASTTIVTPYQHQAPLSFLLFYFFMMRYDADAKSLRYGCEEREETSAVVVHRMQEAEAEGEGLSALASHIQRHGCIAD